MNLVVLAYALAAQVDSLKGTEGAQKGAVQRLADPTYYDMVFPFIAFGLVILLPTSVALWVIVRTLTEKTREPDET
jgi:hypothetical protein